MRIKKYDYLINDNGDIWMVETVHRDGSVTIGHADGSEITYSAGEIESWFRKLPKDVGEANFDRAAWVDPKPYWSPVVKKSKPAPKKHKPTKRSGSPTGLRELR